MAKVPEMKFAVDEQETTVNYLRQDDFIEVYTSDTTMITKLNKITTKEQRTVLTRDKNGKATSVKYVLDVKQLTFRNPPKESTAETKAKRAAYHADYNKRNKK